MQNSRVMQMNGVAIVAPDAPRVPGWTRLVIVSDTHNVDIPAALFPPGDLLIHAGDHTTAGLHSELTSAAAWLRSLAERFTHGAVVIAGNHDRPLDTETWLQAAPLSQPGVAWSSELMQSTRSFFDDKTPDNEGQRPLRLLQHSAIDLAGLKIFGSPYVGLTPRRQAMAIDNPRRYEGFLREPRRLAELFVKIPAGLDLLITHSPPLGILDTSLQYSGVLREKPVAIGSAALRDRLREMPAADRPRLHVFGHEHDSRGVFIDREMGVVFINAAAVDGDQGAIQKGGHYAIKEGFLPWVVDIKTGG